MRVHDTSAPEFKPALCVEMLFGRGGNSGSNVCICRQPCAYHEIDLTEKTLENLSAAVQVVN